MSCTLEMTSRSLIGRLLDKLDCCRHCLGINTACQKSKSKSIRHLALTAQVTVSVEEFAVLYRANDPFDLRIHESLSIQCDSDRARLVICTNGRSNSTISVRRCLN